MTTPRELAAPPRVTLPDRAAGSHRPGPLEFRRTLGRYPTGVAVVTTVGPGGRPVGLTVNSFTSVSLDPPLVLWCLGNTSASSRAFLASQVFAVNVLAADQEGLARRFARPERDRFAGVDWEPGPYDLPLVAETAACLVCRDTRVLAGGDHRILIGEVVECRIGDGAPLLFLDGRFLPAPSGSRSH